MPLSLARSWEPRIHAYLTRHAHMYISQMWYNIYAMMRHSQVVISMDSIPNLWISLQLHAVFVGTFLRATHTFISHTPRICVYLTRHAHTCIRNDATLTVVISTDGTNKPNLWISISVYLISCPSSSVIVYLWIAKVILDNCHPWTLNCLFWKVMF